MSLLGTGRTPQAGTTAEAEALIAEARARARRRRRRIAVAVLGAVAVAAGGLAAAGGFPGSRPAASARSRTAATAEPSGPPAYFLDATASHSPEIRVSATGTVVAPIPIGNVPALRGYDPPYGLAATGPGSFVVGMMTPSDCSTQFFRFQINGQGRPGALTRWARPCRVTCRRSPPARAAGSSLTRSTATAARTLATTGATSGCST